MKKLFLLVFILGFLVKINAQGTLCDSATPFCAGSSSFTFPAGVNAGTGQNGPNYGCLGNTPNPAWYYMQVGQGGNIEFEIHTTPHEDVDFICWGPFTSYTAPCIAELTGSGNPNHNYFSHHHQGAGGGYPSVNIVDCSYDPDWQEWCFLPGTITGEFYILMITNYSNNPCSITFSQTAGNGYTNCYIIPPVISSNIPICEGDNLILSAEFVPNAQYFWDGPNNFVANSQNPTINNVSALNSGVYTCYYTTANGTSASASLSISFLTKPVTSDIYHNY